MILQSQIIEIIGWTIIHSFWQITAIGILIKIGLIIAKNKSSTTKYNISLLGFFAIILVTTVSLTRIILETDQTLPLSENNTALIIHSNSLAADQSSDLKNNPTLYTKMGDFAGDNMNYIVAIWLLGVLFFSVRFVGSYIYIQRLKTKFSNPIGNRWIESFSKISNKLNIKSQVQFLESGLVKIPIVIGYLKPAVILPFGLATSMPFNQLEAIITHELAHIKRNDYIINLLRSIMEPLFFFHPVFWWITKTMNSERENCCDDLTIDHCGTEHHLQNALIDLFQNNQKSIHIAAALYKNEYQLLKRIKRMKTKNLSKENLRKTNHVKRSNLTGLLVLLSSIVFIVIASAFSPRPDDLPKAPQPPVNIAEDLAQPEEVPLPVGILSIPVTAPVVSEEPARIPDTTRKAGERKAIKTKEEKGRVSLELDENGKLVSVKKNGAEVQGEERQKYEKLLIKVKETEEKEKALEQNEKELDRMRVKLKEVEQKMSEVHSQYDQALQEYLKLSQDLDPSAYLDSWSLYEDQLSLAKEWNSTAEFDDYWKQFQDNQTFNNFFEQEDLIKLQEEFQKDNYNDQMDRMEDVLKELELERAIKAEEFIQQIDEIEDIKELEELEWKSQMLESIVREELKKDGLVVNKMDPLEFELSKKKLVVNGKKQSKELKEKYLKLYTKITDEVISGDVRVFIID